MAVTVTTIIASPTCNISDIIATADGDTAATVTHGLGGIPAEVYGTQLISQALTALSAWALTSRLAATVVWTKLASTGSGNAGAQLRSVCRSPALIGV